MIVMKRLIMIIAVAMASVFAASAQVAKTDLSEGMKYKQLKSMYNYKDYSESLDDRYNPTTSAVASFFIPGLGQMISKEVGRGFAWLGGAAGAAFVTGFGNGTIEAGRYYEDTSMENIGAVVCLVGAVSLLTVEIWSIVDAGRVAKVKNMYEQDLRQKYALDIDLHPSVNYIKTATGVQPTAGFTLALNF